MKKDKYYLMNHLEELDEEEFDRIYNQLNIPYKIINADLEYINGNNFGNVHLQLKVNSSSVTELDDYLRKYKLVNSKIEVIQKKEAS